MIGHWLWVVFIFAVNLSPAARGEEHQINLGDCDEMLTALSAGEIERHWVRSARTEQDRARLMESFDMVLSNLFDRALHDWLGKRGIPFSQVVGVKSENHWTLSTSESDTLKFNSEVEAILNLKHEEQLRIAREVYTTLKLIAETSVQKSRKFQMEKSLLNLLDAIEASDKSERFIETFWRAIEIRLFEEQRKSMSSVAVQIYGSIPERWQLASLIWYASVLFMSENLADMPTLNGE